MRDSLIDQRVIKIKNSNDEKSKLIEEYKPFIAATTEKYTGKYVSYGIDDELSIALIAFEEAINKFDVSKGSFLSFAQGVIQRRLIDYYRKEKRHNAVEYINENYLNDESDEGHEYAIASEQARQDYMERQQREMRRLEILQLKEELGKWGITFKDVEKSSPKHQNTKMVYRDIIKYIYEKPELVHKIKNKQYLPIAEIEAVLKLPRKTIERGRNYIVASIIVLTGEYEYIREFADWGWSK